VSSTFLRFLGVVTAKRAKVLVWGKRDSKSVMSAYELSLADLDF